MGALSLLTELSNTLRLCGGKSTKSSHVTVFYFFFFGVSSFFFYWWLCGVFFSNISLVLPGCRNLVIW